MDLVSDYADELVLADRIKALEVGLRRALVLLREASEMADDVGAQRWASEAAAAYNSLSDLLESGT